MEELLAEARKDELAGTYQLGNFLKEYRVTIIAVRVGMVLLVLGIVAYLLICVITALYGPYSLPSAMLIGLIPLGILSGGGTLVFWLGKRWVARRRNWRIYLYEHGLIYHGRDLYPMHWKSVQSIIHTIVEHESSSTNSQGHTTSSRYYTHHYKIYCKDGTELSARGVIAKKLGPFIGGRPFIGGGTFVGGADLIETIELRSAPYLLDEALHLLKSTGQAPFGALTVSQQGLQVREKFLPWQELESFFLSGTAVVFKKKGKWLAWQRCRLGDVVNYEVFTQLVSVLRRNRGTR
jgi:hypothetical protein